jgi:hypothetical protein
MRLIWFGLARLPWAVAVAVGDRIWHRLAVRTQMMRRPPSKLWHLHCDTCACITVNFYRMDEENG